MGLAENVNAQPGHLHLAGHGVHCPRPPALAFSHPCAQNIQIVRAWLLLLRLTSSGGSTDGAEQLRPTVGGLPPCSGARWTSGAGFDAFRIRGLHEQFNGNRVWHSVSKRM